MIAAEFVVRGHRSTVLRAGASRGIDVVGVRRRPSRPRSRAASFLPQHSSAVLDPERDHRGDRCPAILATRDGQPSQPVAACPSMHAARLPRRTRSSPWATALALGGAQGSAQPSWQPKPPVRARHVKTSAPRRPICLRCRRAARRGAGPRETSCTGSRRERPLFLALARAIARSIRPESGVSRSRPSRSVAASPTAQVTGVDQVTGRSDRLRLPG